MIGQFQSVDFSLLTLRILCADTDMSAPLSVIVIISRFAVLT